MHLKELPNIAKRYFGRLLILFTIVALVTAFGSRVVLGPNLMTQQSTTPHNPNEKATTPAATPSTPEKTPAPAHTPEVKKASDQKN